MEFNVRKALVTGGAGFIGAHIVETLVSQGCDVCVVDNLITGKHANLAAVLSSVDFHDGDIRDINLMKRAAQGCDVVFHLAAMVSVPQTVSDPLTSAVVNDLGTLHVLEAARLAGARRVVLSSSSAVYGDNPESPKTEDMAPAPKSPYAVQKRTNELNARMYHDLYGLETVCLRYFNVFGPRQDPSSPYSGVISIFMARATRGQAPLIYGDGGQSRDFVFVKDVVQANLLAASQPGAAGEVFNIGVGGSITVGELWHTISQMAGCDARPIYEPARPGDIYESLSSIEKAVSVLGFNPEYSFDQGLKATLEWYRESADAA